MSEPFMWCRIDGEMDSLFDLLLRMVVIGTLALVFLGAGRGIWWTASHAIVPPSCPRIHLAKESIRQSAESRWSERVLRDEIQAVLVALSGSGRVPGARDPVRIEPARVSAAKGRTAMDSTSVTVPVLPKPPVSTPAIERPVPEVVPAKLIDQMPELPIFDIDLLGIFRFLRDGLDRSPVLHGTVASTDALTRVYADYRGGAGASDVGPWRALASDTEDALRDLAHQFVQDFYLKDDDALRGIATSDFAAFVEGVRTLRTVRALSGEARVALTEALAERLEAARTVFERLTRKFPERAQFHSFLGLALWMQSRPVLASREFQRVLELEPGKELAKLAETALGQLERVPVQGQLEQLLAGTTPGGPSEVLEALSTQPAMKRIRLQEARAAVGGDESPVRIAVVGAGVSTVLAPLEPRIVEIVNLTDDPDPTADLGYGYGTGLANLLGAMNPHSRITVFKIFSSGNFSTTDEQTILKALDAVMERGFDVVYLSFGHTDPSAAGEAALRGLLTSGAVVVAPAGNDAAASRLFPARLKGVIGVGATDGEGHLADFSNYGAAVDVYAPGTDILTVDAAGEPRTTNGTSYSGLLVTGVAGLVKSVAPRTGRDELATLLRDTARAGESGAGYQPLALVDAAAAVEHVRPYQ